TSSHRWKASKRIPIFNVRSLRLSLSPPHYSCFLSLFFSLPPTFFLFFTHSLHCPQINTHTPEPHTQPHTHQTQTPITHTPDTTSLIYTHTLDTTPLIHTPDTTPLIHTHTHTHTHTHIHTHTHTPFG